MGPAQLEAEVVYAAREEMCESAVDFLARRTRLAFLDIRAAEEALPRVNGFPDHLPPLSPACARTHARPQCQ